MRADRFILVAVEAYKNSSGLIRNGALVSWCNDPTQCGALSTGLPTGMYCLGMIARAVTDQS